MKTPIKKLRSTPFSLGILLGVIGAGLAPTTGWTAHLEVSLTGSNFEIDTDANLKVDDASPSLDWANVTETRKQDQPTGTNDDSFAGGVKEDTTDPGITTGSIPNNKSDLKFFGVYQEGTSSSGFLNLFWSRVQEPTGTTNMDFEFNQKQCTSGLTPADPDCSSNGITPQRTAGDLLIIYDLAQGGTRPVLSLREWTGSAWGPVTDLTASNKATGSINTSPIPNAESDGLGPQSARTFGEAQLNLSAIFPSSECRSFGSAYLKSRSSDSFTSQVKDFIAPVPVNITNCGKIKIIKHTSPRGLNQNFSFTSTLPATSTCSQPAPETTTSFTLNDNGNTTADSAANTQDCTNVPVGTHTVTEGDNPAGFAFDNFSCTATGPGTSTTTDLNDIKTASITMAPGGEVTCTYTNRQQVGAIRVIKTRKHAASGSGDHAHAGVSFTINGVTKQTDANGVACFSGLLFGTYTVHETVPAGYQVDQNDKQVTVDNIASCSDTTYVGENVSFLNTPLTDITVSVNSQVDGGTSSTISCVNASAGNVATGSTGTNGDGSAIASNLQPGTYTCTIVVDP